MMHKRSYSCVQCMQTCSPLYSCHYYSEHAYVYCSQRCQFQHALQLRSTARTHYQLTEKLIGAEATNLVVFQSSQLTTQRVEELLLLLNDTQSREKTREATDKFMQWFQLPRIPVFFFDTEDVRDEKNRVVSVVARSVTVDGRTIVLRDPSTKLGEIRNAATDGQSIFVNARIQTPSFQTESRRFIRFQVPDRVTHFAAIMVHEYGHVVHIQPRTRSLLDGLWLHWIGQQKNRMPPPDRFREFVEEIADRFAVSVFALLKK